MSNDTQRADQIAFHFYTKLFYVVNHARATAEPRVQPKVDRWFNLEIPDSDLFPKDSREKYRSISTSPPPAPLEIQVLLSVPDLNANNNNNQVLAYIAPDSSRIRVDPIPTHILLESWVLAFVPRGASGEDDSAGSADVALPTIYKHGIPLFRSLFSLLRILPAWKLYKRLRRRTGGANRNGNLSIQLRVRTGSSGSNSATEHDSDDRILGFHTPLAANTKPLPTQTHAFPPVPHPMGTLSLTARYLTTPNFQLDELESLLSSRFLTLDEGSEFVPTLAKNQQRESSISGSPGSLPIRTSLPKSPPQSVADRFVLPSRTASLPGVGAGAGGGGSPHNIPPTGRYTLTTAHGPSPGPGSTSGISAGSYPRPESRSSTWSKDESPTANPTLLSRPPSGLAARLRKESTGGGRGGDLPSAPSPSPSPLAIRRPSINPVHPFKSSTLSSGSPSQYSASPSQRQASPLSSIGLPNFPSVPRSPTSSRPVPPSPIGGLANRPLPSSLGDRRSVEGNEEASVRVPVPGRKRYSSSFGHRYNASGGAGSEGSAGSGERREGERVGSASFLSTNTDDDDISVFVQDIDARKPLSGRHRIHEKDREGRRQGDRQGEGQVQGQGHDRETTLKGGRMGAGDRDRDGGGVEEGVVKGAGGSGVSPSGAMLTSESEVDERLRRMNEAFLASLEGLGGAGGSGSGGSGSGSARRREREREQREREWERERRRHDDSSGSSESQSGGGGARAMTDGGGEGIGAALAAHPAATRDSERRSGVPFGGGRPRYVSLGANTSEGAGGQGSEGRMDVDESRRRYRGQ